MNLGPLFHWSPLDRRESILKEGLVPGSNSLHGSGVFYVCLGMNPRRAWQLSGDTDWGSEEDDWDLWQVTLRDTDEVRIRAEYGPEIWEVKVHNVIPPDRLWWVGARQPWLTA
jgi:hypothetical protein